jgi:Carboxypeptidase regulatory-like domain
VSRGATRFLLFAALALLATASPFAAQPRGAASAVILGTVGDSGLRPIAGANVGFAGSRVHVASDSLGRFHVVNVPAGHYMLVVRAIGYRTATEVIDVNERDTLRLAFTLEPIARGLEGMKVTERGLSPKLQEFEMRRKGGIGTFVTRAEIEAAKPLATYELLRKSISVSIVPNGRGLMAVSTPGKGCAMPVFLDGLPFRSAAEGPATPPDVTLLPPPSEIAGIEIYSGAASIPVWLFRNLHDAKSGCGAILIWTKDRLN